ncbi:MAG: hypothetical protein ACRD9Q_08975 [Nitrososphaeraceae archaeon]
MKLVCFGFTGVLIIGLAFAIPVFLADWANAQNQNQSQNLSPSMVINMSDLSIKVGNITSNETITFSNNTTNQSGNSSS